MSSPPVTSATPTLTGEALRAQMERSIDDLADLARSGAEPGRFFAEVLRRAQSPGGAARVTLWRNSTDSQWEIAGEQPAGGLTGQQISERQESLHAAASSLQPHVIPGVAGTDCRILSPLRHASTTVGILETFHAGPAHPAAVTIHFLAALSEIAADFLAHQELALLRQARTNWLQWDQFQGRIQQSFELDAVCDVVANDGRVLVGCDRIAVLIRSRGRYQVVAISGVERLDTRSGSLQSLERLARATTRDSQNPEWRSFGDPATAPLITQSAAEEYWRETGVSCLGVVPIPVSGEFPTAATRGLLILENFSPHSGWNELQPRALQLAQRSAYSLNIALERRDVPWLKTWLRIRSLRQQTPRLALIAAACFFILALLVLIPAELTVTGPAELWPAVRRNVFASSSGIVDQILVQHGDMVQPDQSLIQLRDPDLDQDIPRISGEIATTQERLRGVQIARLTGVAAPDSAMHSRQLTAEEGELTERLKSLRRQQQLIEERRSRLTLRSPIAGQILTWDLEQHLQARPVERGQSLLTVGETAGAWVMEIRVADKDAGHVLKARQDSAEPLQVDFQLPSEPGQRHRGTIRSVALATESSVDSMGYLRVIVEFESGQVAQLRPGANAIPRIHCGRKSLGYVWLHDLIDAAWIRLML